jgi:hypothetical protein
MTPPHSIPQHVWDSLMDEARTVIGAVVDRLEKRLAEAQRQIQEFRPRLDEKSTNSSKPLRGARFSHATSNTGIGIIRARARPRASLRDRPMPALEIRHLNGPASETVPSPGHDIVSPLPGRVSLEVTKAILENRLSRCGVGPTKRQHRARDWARRSIRTKRATSWRGTSVECLSKPRRDRLDDQVVLRCLERVGIPLVLLEGPPDHRVA